MTYVTYQQDQLSKAENRTANHANCEKAWPASASLISRDHVPDAPMRNAKHSIGNQNMLRMQRHQAVASATSGVAITGAPQLNSSTAQQQPTQPLTAQPPASQPTSQPGQTPPTAQTQPLPFTAVFLIAQHSSAAHQACGLPDTSNCVVSAANWRLIDRSGAPVKGNITLSEQFTKESGPDEVFQKLNAQKNSAKTSQNGAFSDCYGLCVPEGTQPFSLQVLQNYLVDGQIASKNHITYSSTGVMLRVCQREANGTFGDRCRRY